MNVKNIEKLREINEEALRNSWVNLYEKKVKYFRNLVAKTHSPYNIALLRKTINEGVQFHQHSAGTLKNLMGLTPGKGILRLLSVVNKLEDTTRKNILGFYNTFGFTGRLHEAFADSVSMGLMDYNAKTHLYKVTPLGNQLLNVYEEV